ncbi:MAG: hypothetical protein L6Q47_08880 [Ignavibacteriaceae bacterium]|nr:hypothetical protein [Ignavibacteriaceae bacterium]
MEFEEEILKVLDENIVPMTDEEISKELVFEECGIHEGNFNTPGMMRFTVKHLPLAKGEGIDSTKEEGVENKVYYWTTKNFDKLIVQFVKDELAKNNGSVKLSWVFHAFLNRLKNMFGIRGIDLKSKYFQDLDIEYLVLEEDEYFWVEFVMEYLEKTIARDNTFIIYGESKQVDINDVIIGIRHTKEEATSRILLKKVITQIISASKNKTILFDVLLLKLNLFDIDVPYQKPFNKELLYSVLMEFNDYFEISDNRISLIRNLKSVEKIIKNTFRFSETAEIAISASGLIGFVFIGDNFLVPQASEYVKLRNLVSIQKADDVELLLSDKFETTEIYQIIKKLLKTDKETIEWIQHNIQIGVYYDEPEYLREIASEIMSKFAPVFNLVDNPGNLFTSSLRELFESRDDGTEK